MTMCNLTRFLFFHTQVHRDDDEEQISDDDEEINLREHTSSHIDDREIVALEMLSIREKK